LVRYRTETDILLPKELERFFGGVINRAVLINDLSQTKERVVIGELDIALQKDLIGG
jgi:hypothetical protein